MSDRYVIETPENISFGYDVAGIGSRFLAVFVDTLIQGTLYMFLVIVLVMASSLATTLNLPNGLTNLVPFLTLLTLFIVQFGYFMLFELVTAGQTPGKRLLHLRVIKENGYPLTPVDSVIRNLIRIIDFFPFAYGMGVIVMFLNERSKRLGDFAAGTLVVKMRDELNLSSLQTSTPNTEAPDLPGSENLREADVELIEAFLARRAELKDSRPLASTIAHNIRARMNAAEPTGAHTSSSSDADFLQQVVLAYRKNRRRT